MNKTWLIAAAATAFLAVGAAQAQTVPMTPELAKIIEGAKKEGKLVLRHAPTTIGGPDGARIAQIGIKEQFGVDIPVEWSPAGAFGPLAAQLYQEYQAGTTASADVYYATPAQILPYLSKGLFKEVDWAKIEPSRVTAEMVEGDKHALRIADALPAIIYNPKNAKWVADIHTTEDLLKPQYKGKFVTTPFLGGFDALLAPEVWGVEKTRTFITKFSDQIGGLLFCGGHDRIASGEFDALVVDCSGTWANTLKYRDKGVLAAQIIDDMAQRRYAYLTVLSHAAHPNAGILFTLYMVSHDGQEKVMWDYYGQDLDSYPDSHIGKQVAELKARGVKTIDVTMDWWRSHEGIEKQNAELAKLVAGH